MTTTIITHCTDCKKEVKLETTTELFIKWKNNQIKIQSAFPNEPPDKREVLISGSCGECFDKLFPDME